MARAGTTNEVREMFKRSLPAIVAVAALIAAPATASAKHSYKIGFQKDCPEYTCTGTLLDRSGTPIPGTTVSSTQTPQWQDGDLVGYSAVETFTRHGKGFTMNLLGVADYGVDPTVTDVVGVVARGSWLGRPLAGALVRGSAARVGGPTFRGVLRITPYVRTRPR